MVLRGTCLWESQLENTSAPGPSAFVLFANYSTARLGMSAGGAQGQRDFAPGTWTRHANLMLVSGGSESESETRAKCGQWWRMANGIFVLEARLAC